MAVQGTTSSPSLTVAPTQTAFPSFSPTPEPSPVPKIDIYKDLWAMIDGSTATIPLSEAIAADLMGIDIDKASDYINHNTTPAAYENLINKKADLIFVTAPSEDEMQEAKKKGVELEVIPVVKDAFVFLVNKENPVKNLTLKQVQLIYTGETVNWKDLGGSDSPIIAYQRPENSGSQTLFSKLVMNGLTPMEPPLDWVEADMGGLVDVVSSYDNGPSAIGYSVFYYVSDMYGNDRFRLLSIDGVSPDKSSIARGVYPLETYYYAVIRTDTPADSPARKMIEWLISDEGQKVAMNAGYVPLREIK